MKLKEIMGYVFIILVVILIRTFVFTIIKVNQVSMVDTLHDGDFMILKKFDKSFDRFDIVVVDDNGDKIIKRIIGLPKEDIEYSENTLFINGEELEDKYGVGITKDFKDYCAADEYFVMGDNREVSKDSRIIGCVNKKQIMGTTDFIIFPFNRFGKVE